MTTFDQTKIHELIQNPSCVDLNLQDKLCEAYKDVIHDLKSYFTKSSDIFRPAIPVTLYYYSDNGGAFEDSAPKEIKRFLNDTANIVSVLSGIEKPNIEYANTPAQNWNASGFELAQTTRHGLLGVGNVTFLNCAPRLDERGKEENKTNAGEPVYVGVLSDGHVVVANSRYNLVHFRDAIKHGVIEFFEANVQTDGTQFRSRDIFPLFVVLLTNQLTQNLESWHSYYPSLEERRNLLKDIGLVNLEKPLPLEDIPKLEGFSVLHIDVHGNIKLNVRESDVHEKTFRAISEHGLKKVKIGDKIMDAEIVKTPRLFDIKSGEAGLYTGSSGANWDGANTHDGFLEIAIVGGNAAKGLGLTIEELKEIKIVEFVSEYERTVNVPEKKLTHSEAMKYYSDNSEFKDPNQSIWTPAHGL